VLHDRLPDAGPLGGVEAALASAAHPLLLVLAVDLPEIQAGLLRRLARQGAPGAGAVPRVNGALEPLAAFYPRAALPLARQLLNLKKSAMRGFVEHCRAAGLVEEVDMTAAARQFLNWNSPADRTAVSPDARS
jgi:molybdopterin-guanine dinucleotide biosynthesis protein A